jgi:hypothetical protein
VKIRKVTRVATIVAGDRRAFNFGNFKLTRFSTTAFSREKQSVKILVLGRNCGVWHLYGTKIGPGSLLVPHDYYLQHSQEHTPYIVMVPGIAESA